MQNRTADPPRDVCLLTDPYLLPWQIDALETLVEETDARIALVVVNDPAYADRRSQVERQETIKAAVDDDTSIGRADLELLVESIRAEGGWTLVLAERKLAWLLGLADSKWLKREPIDDIDVLSDAVKIHCAPEYDGVWEELPSAVVERIADDSDVAVRFGFGLLRGDVLDAPEHGVLSFHSADIREYRGLGPDLAFHNRKNTAGSTLQRLTETIDGGEIICIDHVDVSDARTSDEIRQRVYELQTKLLARGIKRLGDPEFDPSEPELAEYTPHDKRTSLRYSGSIALRNAFGRLHQAILR